MIKIVNLFLYILTNQIARTSAYNYSKHEV